MPSLQSLLTDTYSLRRGWVVDYAEFPTDIFPVIYGQLSGGKGGISYCPGIVEDTHTYLIADHVIQSAAEGNSPTFYVDNEAVEPESWSHGTVVAGRTAATVTFGTNYAGSRIGYRGAGKTRAGTLLTNPVDVVEDFLTAIIGIDPYDFDLTALATARANAARAGYVCAGVLDQDRSPAATISEMLSCFAGYYYISSAGKIVLVIDDGRVPTRHGLAGHLRVHEFERAEATSYRTDICNQVAVSFARNHYDITLQQRFQDADDGRATADAVSQQQHGAIGPGATEPAMEWPWVRSAASVAAAQRVVVSRLATPRLRVRMSSPSFRLVHLNVGQHVGFSWPRLYDDQGLPLQNQLGIIEEIVVDGDNAKVDLALRDTGAYIDTATVADGSETADGALHAGSDRDRTDYY